MNHLPILIATIAYGLVLFAAISFSFFGTKRMPLLAFIGGLLNLVGLAVVTYFAIAVPSPYWMLAYLFIAMISLMIFLFNRMENHQDLMILMACHGGSFLLHMIWLLVLYQQLRG